MENIADKLEWIGLSLPFVLPEAVLTGGILVLLVIGVLTRSTRWAFSTSLFFLLTSFFISLYQFSSAENTVALFNGALRYSPLSVYWHLLFDLSTLLALLLSTTVRERLAEYAALLVTATLGAHLLVMSTHLTLVFLSIEVISLPSYLLAAWGFEKRNLEAALKYFLFGSVASAVMLYGFSLLYGITGTLDFTSAAFRSQLYLNQSPYLVLIVCFVLAGFLFKIASAPFHTWAPDVYEAVPTPVVAFFSVVPKLAGIGILITFFHSLQLDGRSLLHWQVVLGNIILLTLVVGNFAAVVQTQVKRLLAYSSIAQAGFLLIGVITWQVAGLHALLWYSAALAIGNFLVFYGLAYFERYGVVTVGQFAGAVKQHTRVAVFILLGMLSLTGLPPTAGFMGKLLLFTSLWEAVQTAGSVLYLALFIVGLLTTVVALFFYLKIPYYAFLKSTPPSTSATKSIFVETIVGWVLAIALVVLFFLPHILMGWLNRITFA